MKRVLLLTVILVAAMPFAVAAQQETRSDVDETVRTMSAADISSLTAGETISVSPDNDVAYKSDNTVFYFQASEEGMASVIYLPEDSSEMPGLPLFKISKGKFFNYHTSSDEAADEDTPPASFISEAAFVEVAQKSHVVYCMEVQRDGKTIISAMKNNLSYGPMKDKKKYQLKEGYRAVLYPGKSTPEVEEIPQDEMIPVPSSMIDAVQEVAGEEAAAVVASVGQPAENSPATVSDTTTPTGVSVTVTNVSSGTTPEGKQEIISVRIEFDPSMFFVEDNGESGEPPVPPTISSIVIGGVDIMSHSGGQTVRIDPANLDGGQLVLSGNVGGAEEVIMIEISLDGGITWITIMGTGDWEYSFDPQGGIVYSIQIRVTTTDGANFTFPVGTVEQTYEDVEEPEIPVLDSVQLLGNSRTSLDIPSMCPALLMRDDLDNGVLVMSGEYDDPDNKVDFSEISFDGGYTWNRTNGRKNWTYQYRSHGEEEINLHFRVTTRSGDRYTDEMSGECAFPISGDSYRDLLENTVYEQFDSYQDEDAGTFMSHVSPNYSSGEPNISNPIQLENSIRMDYNDSNYSIYPADLQYDVTSIDLQPGDNTASVTIQWNNSGDGSFRSSSTLTYVFEAGEWKLTSITGEPPFGTGEKLNTPARITLELDSASIVADGRSTVTVTATVQNEYGDRLPEAEVTFSVTPSTAGTFSEEEQTTDTSGQAATQFSPARSYSNTIEATITATSGTTSDSSQLEIGSDAPPPLED